MPNSGLQKAAIDVIKEGRSGGVGGSSADVPTRPLQMIQQIDSYPYAVGSMEGFKHYYKLHNSWPRYRTQSLFTGFLFKKKKKGNKNTGSTGGAACWNRGIVHVNSSN
jgi:hypothetical protein